MNRCLLLVIACIAILSGGCALDRSVVTIPLDQIEDPAGGPVVVITDVRDQRSFERSPELPQIPSLKNDEIDDPSITSRAIARKRNGFGAAIGDVVLAEGGSVAHVVQVSLENTLREEGYRIAPDAATAPADALPVTVDIHKFWCWLEPGMWYIAARFEGELAVEGPIFQSGSQERFQAEFYQGHQYVADGDWVDTATNGLKELMNKVRAKLKKPGS